MVMLKKIPQLCIEDRGGGTDSLLNPITMYVGMHIYVTFKINTYWWLGSVAINNSFLWHIT